MPDDETDLSETIATNAQGPAEARGDSSAMRQHSLKDQIEADKYLASKRSRSATGKGLNLFKLQPPGIS